jgi:hypothetical protein
MAPASVARAHKGALQAPAGYARPCCATASRSAGRAEAKKDRCAWRRSWIEPPPPWKLDRKDSTRFSLKYRRGKGDIRIVSHDGSGWWDPTSDPRDDVFRLVQRLEPGLNFGHVSAPNFATFRPTQGQEMRSFELSALPSCQFWSGSPGAPFAPPSARDGLVRPKASAGFRGAVAELSARRKDRGGQGRGGQGPILARAR